MPILYFLQQAQRRCLVCLIIFLAMACRGKFNQSYDKPFFDFDSLIHAQIKYQQNKKTLVKKNVLLGTEKEVSQFISDSLLLSHEWEVYKQLDDINKPIYKNGYRIVQSTDTQSGLQIRSYLSTAPCSVPYLHFYYRQNFQHLLRIESLFIKKNPLYFTQRILTLHFDTLNRIPSIQRYTLQSTQKFVWGDTVKFSVDGSIHYQ